MTQDTTPTSGAADLPAMVSKALREAYYLGQRYWQQTDSEYISQHKKADDTRAKFLALVEETCAALAAGQAAAAQPGVVYAELPVPNYPKSGGFPGTFAEAQMHAFADATHALRASHGQALRLLTQKEKDSLGRRAEGMDGNEWDQWVQEKFAQVNGLKVQGGSYERDWE